MSWKYRSDEIDLNKSTGVDSRAIFGFDGFSPRAVHTGGVPAQVSTAGTDATPVVTELYLAECNLPASATITGIAVMNGSAVGDGIKVGLFNVQGTLLATNAVTTAGTTTSGTDSYQRIPFTAALFVPGPQTLWVGVIFNGTTSRLNTHTFGNFGAGKITGQVYSTAFASTALSGLTMPTTFTTALGPIASLY